MSKNKIHLTGQEETLLVPLYSKAIESEKNHPIISDPKAVEIFRSIDYDFRQLRVPRQTLVTLAMRAKKLDSLARAFINENENPLILHLGCGLDSRVLRVGNDTVQWYDLDYPEVIRLRKTFYEETAWYRMIPAEVTDTGWLEAVEQRGPACIIAEGLLMYLREEQIKSLFLELRRRLPHSQIAFDVYSRLAAKGASNHPSIKKTGARIHWGIDDGAQIEQWGEGIKLLEEWYFSDSQDIVCLGFWYRVMFAAAGTFKAARKAHRVLHVQL